MSETANGPQDWNDVAVKNRMDLPRFSAGKDGPMIFSASTMNVAMRVLRALTNPMIVRGERDDVKLTDGNMMITLAADPASASVIKQFVLKDYSGDDHLVCRQWNGAEEVGEDILVAKPWTLRMTPFDGQTFDYVREEWNGSSVDLLNLAISFTYRTPTLRTVTGTIDGGDEQTEDQVVIPRFKIDSDIIYAITAPDLGLTVGELPVTLLDLNVDARAWMKQS